jgi:hypothetical protein
MCGTAQDAPAESQTKTTDNSPGASRPGQKGRNIMRTQNLVKSGLAMTSAVALLVISALSPSTALGSIGGKLYSTIEPGASCQYQMSVTTYGGTVTISCKGLTPGGTYWLEVDEWVSIPLYGEHFMVPVLQGSAVASRTGSLKFQGSFSVNPINGASIESIQFSVVNQYGARVF